MKKIVGNFLLIVAAALSLCGILFCSACGEEQTSTPHQHSFGAWQTEEPATCEQSGTERRYCDGCEEFEERVTDPLDHNFGAWTVEKEAECTVAGKETRVCSRCPKTEERTIDPLNHQYGEWETVEQSTCIRRGLKHRVCSRCKNEETEELPIGEHAFSQEWIVDREATCAEEGHRCHQCTVCGARDQGESIKRLEHEYDKEWKIDKEPLVGVAGEKSHHCLHCSDRIDITVIPAIVAVVGSEGLEYIFDDNLGAYVCAGLGSCTEKDITIASHVGSVPVVAIRFAAFTVRNEITSVKVPDTVTTIGSDAFTHCENLKSVSIAGAVKIERRAFAECSSLTAVTLPETLTSLEEMVFSSCTALERISLPDSLEQIPNHLFESCSALKSVAFGAKVRSIGNSAFYLCEAFEHAQLPETLVSLGEYAFYESGIMSLQIPEGITEIPYRAFTGCKRLHTVVIPDTVKKIGNEAFSNCKITELDLGHGVQSIGKEAFTRCLAEEIVIPDSVTYAGWRAFGWGYGTLEDGTGKGIQKVTIGNSLERIAEGMFENCAMLSSVTFKTGVKVISRNSFRATALLSVVLPEGVTEIGDYAFYGTAIAELSLPDSLRTVGRHAFYGCSFTEIQLGENLQSIDYGAFEGCGNLTSVVLPASLKTLGDWAFSRCGALQTVFIGAALQSIGEEAFNTHMATAATEDVREWGHLTEITVDPKNEHYCSVDGNLYSKDGTVLYRYASGKADETFTVPAGVTELAPGAVNHAYYLKRVVFPESLKEIGDSAFWGCLELTEVSLPAVETIAIGAFSDCKKLNTLSFGEVPVRLGAGLRDCQSLCFTQYENAKYLGNEENPHLILVCGADSGIESCTVHENTRLIADQAFVFCTQLKEIIVPASVQRIGESAFHTTSLERAEIHAKEIGKMAFESLPLTSVILGDEVVSIGDGAFRDNDQLTDLRMSSSLRSIGEVAFAHCWKLERVELPASLEIVKFGAFRNCAALREIAVAAENPVYESIGGHLFEKGGKTFLAYANGAAAERYEVPASVTRIEAYAFMGATLTTIVLPQGLETIGDSAFWTCERLTQINLPDSITKIGSGAFGSCTSLVSLTLPARLTVMEQGLVAMCANLENITLPQSLIRIEERAFAYCNSLVTVALPASLQVIEREAFYECDNLSELIIPSSVTEIGSEVFYNCLNFLSITFEDPNGWTINVADGTIEREAIDVTQNSLARTFTFEYVYREWKKETKA